MRKAVKVSVTILVIFSAAFGGLLVFRAENRRKAVLGEEETFLRHAGAVIENFLAGLNEGDYERASCDFDAQMKIALPEDIFLAAREEIVAEVGRWHSGEIVEVSEQAGYKLVVYKAQFEMDEVEAQVSLRRYGDADLISGLWFDLTRLRE